MPTTLICTLGRLTSYEDACTYYFEGMDIGRAIVPVSALARHFKPNRIVLLCPGVAQEAAQWFIEELEPHGLPEPITRSLPIPHSESDLTILLNELALVLNDEVRVGNDIHLDLSLGLRFITILGLLTADLLSDATGVTISRLTCINLEGARDTGVAEVLDITSYLHLDRLRAAVEALEARGDIELLARTVARAFPGSLSVQDVADAAELQRRLSLLRVRQATSKNTGRVILRRIIATIRASARNLTVLHPIAERVAQNLSTLDPGDLDSFSPRAIARLATWYASHGMPVQAILLIDEAVDQFKGNLSLGDRRYKFSDLRKRSNDLRNTIAHADWSPTSSSVSIELSQVEDVVSTFSAACEDLPC